MTQNSPANRVPSHGTALFASSFAIDFVPLGPSGRSAPTTARTLLGWESTDRFAGFGEPIVAPVSGLIVGVCDGAADHAAYRGLSSVGYALTQRRRLRAGWEALAGNHVLIACDDGVVVAICHLKSGSVRVALGDAVARGETIAACGNSGNSTEPHVHQQAMTGPDPAASDPVEMVFPGGTPRTGAVISAPAR